MASNKNQVHIPTADTFRRVFARLDPKAFERCFMGWMRGLAGSLDSKLFAVDGNSEELY